MYHMTDILPTLLHLANITIPNNNNNIDGINIFDSLSNNQPSPRKSTLHNIDGYEMYTKGEFKIVKGTTSLGLYDTWIHRDMHLNVSNPCYANDIKKSDTSLILEKYSRKLSIKKINQLRKTATVNCNRKNFLPKRCKAKSTCLFNIIEDPCEIVNLAKSKPEILNDLLNDLIKYRNSTVTPRNQPLDDNANPSYHCMRWTWWFDELKYQC